MKLAHLSPLSLVYDWYLRRACRLDEDQALVLTHQITHFFYGLLAGRRRKNMLKFFGETRISPERLDQIEKEHLEYQTNHGIEIARGGIIPFELMLERNALLGEDHLQAALKEGRGVLIASPHIGNFYGFMMNMALRGYADKMTGISEAVPIASMEDQANRLRERFKIDTFFLNKGAARAAAKTFRRGAILSIFFDVGMRSNELVWLPFGQTQIGLDSGPARLAVRFGVPVLPSTAYIQKPFHSQFSLGPAFAPAQGEDEEAKVMNTLIQWKDWLEREVTENPAQWWPWSFLELGNPPQTKKK